MGKKVRNTIFFIFSITIASFEIICWGRFNLSRYFFVLTLIVFLFTHLHQLETPCDDEINFPLFRNFLFQIFSISISDYSLSVIDKVFRSFVEIFISTMFNALLIIRQPSFFLTLSTNPLFPTHSDETEYCRRPSHNDRSFWRRHGPIVWIHAYNLLYKLTSASD